MTHDEIGELLGAYAVHATELDEQREIEVHLAECPRCRAEVEAHLEVTALLGSSGTEPPEGLWEKIASSLAESKPSGGAERPSPTLGPNVLPLGRGRSGPARWPVIWGAVASVAAALIAFLGIEVAHLHSEVGNLDTAVNRNGLAGAAAQVAVGPHRTVALTSATHSQEATIIVAASGQAFWVSSSLRNLPSSRTYQLWGLARGQVVSLGLVGPDPHDYAAFRVEAGVTEVMITAEPAGGTPKPTTSVLALGDVPPSVAR